jgi:hypothetical protein
MSPFFLSRPMENANPRPNKKINRPKLNFLWGNGLDVANLNIFTTRYEAVLSYVSN